MATVTDLENYTVTQLEKYTITELEQTFTQAAESTSRYLHRFFMYNGTERKSYLLSSSPIIRDAQNIVAGEVTVELVNTDETWNMFLTDKTNCRKTAILKIGCPAKKTLFTGYGDDVKFRGTIAELKLRDNMALMLEKEVGSDESPVDYYSSAYNPADLVWDLLTTHGGLDNTTSSSNTDIDYDQWSNWKSDCDVLQYSLKAKLTGETIGEVLQKIAHLTQSYIYVNGEGKFVFYRFLPTLETAYYTITSSKYLLNPKPEIEVDFTDLVNDLTCYYGYDPSTGNWSGSVSASDSSSQTAFGTKSDVIEDTDVWHATSASAQEYCNRRIEVYANPLELLTFTMPLMGADRELGERIKVTMTMPGNYSSIDFEIWRLKHNTLTDGTSEITVRNASGDILTPFRLDDEIYALLDQDYNPLY